uniref:Small ribosomal subunit protein uS7 domain-containing protein n=1 Tax=Rhinolophus ferrumequinum TaxID=59479 RepID=A0A671FGW8_RHIFE
MQVPEEFLVLPLVTENWQMLPFDSCLWTSELTQVRWSRSGPEYRDPQIDKGYYRKELGKTQHVKAAPTALALKPSSVFENPLISTFTNMMMKGGNKVLARSLMTHTLADVKRKQFEKYHAASVEEQVTREHNPYTIFHQALKNCEPVTGLVPILKGGHFYQVPVPLANQWHYFLAMEWMIIEYWEKKYRRVLMPEKLSYELLQAFHNKDPVIPRKHDMYKMAEAEQVLAHYTDSRWHRKDGAGCSAC